MHPIRKQRLIFILILLCAIAITVALALYALKQNINLFYSPKQLTPEIIHSHHSMRLGGLVQKGSFVRDHQRVHFTITDLQASVVVYYQGLLPDLFREGQGVVVEGQFQPDGTFLASQVLAKHDENYMPPQVAASLKS